MKRSDRWLELHQFTTTSNSKNQTVWTSEYDRYKSQSTDHKAYDSRKSGYEARGGPGKPWIEEVNETLRTYIYTPEPFVSQMTWILGFHTRSTAGPSALSWMSHT